MTFTIHLIFTILAGLIFRPLFSKFCSCFFFHVEHMVFNLMFDEFLFEKKVFSHPLQLCAHFNGLPHSMHGTLCFMNFSLLKILSNIFHMNSLFGMLQHMFLFLNFSKKPTLLLACYSTCFVNFLLKALTSIFFTQCQVLV